MLKRICAVLLSVMMLTLALAGCSKKTDTPSSDSSNGGTESEGKKQITITVGGWPKETDEARVKTYEGFVQTMKEKYPEITIEKDEWVYDVNSFLPKAESGQLPTIFGTWFTEPQKIIEAGYAADITDALNKNGYMQALNPDMLKIMQKDGKTYGIPTSGYVVGMWYNMKLMGDAGFLDDKGMPKFPKTYDELAEMAKTIKDKTGKAGFFFPTKNNQGGWMFMNIAWAYGAEFEKQVSGKWQAVFNSQEAVDALQYIKDLKWKYDVLTDNLLVEANDMFQLFGTDQVGTAFGTVDWMNAPVTEYKMSKDNIAMSRLPSGPKANVSLLGGGLIMFAPNSTPEQIDAAFKWLEVTGVTPKTDAESLKGSEETLKADQAAGKIVGPHNIRAWVNPDRVSAEDALRSKYANVKMELWNDYVESTTDVIKAEEPVNCQELYKTLDSVIQAVLTDKNADPKALLDKAVADFQRDYLDKVNN